MGTRNPHRVGYGSPPLETRFKPGQSGNPSGRPKGTLNLKTDLEAELKATLVVRENGRSLRVSRQRVAVKVLTEKALHGDLKAMGLLLGLMERVLGSEPEAPATLPDDIQDRETLRRALHRLQGKLGDTDGAPNPKQRRRT